MAPTTTEHRLPTAQELHVLEAATSHLLEKVTSVAYRVERYAESDTEEKIEVPAQDLWHLTFFFGFLASSFRHAAGKLDEMPDHLQALHLHPWDAMVAAGEDSPTSYKALNLAGYFESVADEVRE